VTWTINKRRRMDLVRKIVQMIIEWWSRWPARQDRKPDFPEDSRVAGRPGIGRKGYSLRRLPLVSRQKP
jgi:hypothetical protein